jgi:hypothetical protein
MMKLKPRGDDMKISGGLRWGTRVLGSLAASMVAAVAFTSTPASAEIPVVRMVMYEVTEALRFKPAATDPADFERRMAAASLLGVDVQPLAAGTPFAVGQFTVTNATSNVDLLTGHGPVKGSIDLLTDLDPTRNSLDTLLITAVIRIKADLDLTTATQGFAGINGTWKIKNTEHRGHFTGFFVIPFQLPGLGTQYWYVDLGPGACATTSPVPGLCPLTPGEFVLGIPLTKAVIVLSDRAVSVEDLPGDD